MSSINESQHTQETSSSDRRFALLQEIKQATEDAKKKLKAEAAATLAEVEADKEEIRIVADQKTENSDKLSNKSSLPIAGSTAAAVAMLMRGNKASEAASFKEGDVITLPLEDDEKDTSEMGRAAAQLRAKSVASAKPRGEQKQPVVAKTAGAEGEENAQNSDQQAQNPLSKRKRQQQQNAVNEFELSRKRSMFSGGPAAAAAANSNLSTSSCPEKLSSMVSFDLAPRSFTSSSKISNPGFKPQSSVSFSSSVANAGMKGPSVDWWQGGNNNTSNESSAAWAPPQGQSGDGKTNLNKLLGY